MPDGSGPTTLQVMKIALARASALLGPISFTLPHPGCWWLAGPSGAGKSLLMASLAGFQADCIGNIIVNGKDVRDFPPEQRSISIMPQRWRLFPHWTVDQNLRFAARFSAAPAQRIAALADRLEVAQLLDRSTRELSGGETQRIALIQTLLSSARILLLDEPLSAVDGRLQSLVLELLKEEAGTGNRICIIAAHRPISGYPMDGVLSIERGNLIDKTSSTDRQLESKA